MYNQIFSDVWFMDRCIEASFIVHLITNPIILFFIIFAASLLYYKTVENPKLFIKKFLKVKTRIAWFISLLISVCTSLILIFPVLMVIYFFSLVFGFLIFNCNFGPLWDQIQPAHALHASLKEVRENQGASPRTAEELRQINPKAYELLEESGVQFFYEYKQDSKGYHFFFRPSKYLIADFSDTKDFILYRTESIISPHLFKENPILEQKVSK